MQQRPLRQRISSWVPRAGLVVGVALGALAYVLLPGAAEGAGPGGAGLSDAARMTAAVGVLMAVWWLTEALPIEATALVPIAVFPILGISTVQAAAAPYSDPVIFLFLGGLVLGAAMERCGLHRRIALGVIGLTGPRPAVLLGGVMAATGVVSAWVSNTATAVMMLPIGASIADALSSPSSPRDGRRFGSALMLGIAYAASIGGVATLVGTPPNALLAAYVRSRPELDPIDFADWMLVGVPVALVLLPAVWAYLAFVRPGAPRRVMPGLGDELARLKGGLGRMSAAEARVLAVFVAAALLWIVREPLGRGLGLIVVAGDGRVEEERLTDAGIAMAAALALFIIPAGRPRAGAAGQGADAPPPGAGRLMDWATASRVPWGVLVLFGGGLSLASAISRTGLDRFLGEQFGRLEGAPPLVVIAAFTIAIVFLTEVASNTAVATTFIPIAAAAAAAMGLHPYAVLVPVTIGASLAFMLPMGTPPNALVFSTGRVTMAQMAGVGFWVNWIAIVVLLVITSLVAPAVLGFESRLW